MLSAKYDLKKRTINIFSKQRNSNGSDQKRGNKLKPLPISQLLELTPDGETALLCAVIQSVIDDCQNGAPYQKKRAEVWLLSESNAMGSLKWICSLLGLDPEVIRSGVDLKAA